MSKVNPLEEVRDELVRNGKTLDDVIWFGDTHKGIREIRGLTLEEYLNVEASDSKSYIDVNNKIVLVGEDFWVEGYYRLDSDEGSWTEWQYQSRPVRTKYVNVRKGYTIKNSSYLLEAYEGGLRDE